MSEVTSTPACLLNKLEVRNHEKIIKIYIILRGYDFGVTRRYRKKKTVNSVIAMEGTFNSLQEWKNARNVKK